MQLIQAFLLIVGVLMAPLEALGIFKKSLNDTFSEVLRAWGKAMPFLVVLWGVLSSHFFVASYEQPDGTWKRDWKGLTLLLVGLALGIATWTQKVFHQQETHEPNA